MMVGVVVRAQAQGRAVRVAVALAVVNLARAEVHQAMAHGQIVHMQDVSSLLFVDFTT